MKKDYTRTTPCSDCPYRLDAPLRKWSIEEFRDLLRNDRDPMGVVYGCHKKDGHVCVGWLMDQDKRRLPSIALRMSLLKHDVTVEYLDKLNTPCGSYDSIEEMATTNYPELNDELYE